MDLTKRNYSRHNDTDEQRMISAVEPVRVSNSNNDINITILKLQLHVNSGMLRHIFSISCVSEKQRIYSGEKSCKLK